MNIKRFLSLSTLILTTVYSAFSQCEVGGTDFETTKPLCAPILKTSGEIGEGGWYDEELVWDDLCTGDRYSGPVGAIHKGLSSNTLGVQGSLDMTDVSKVFLANNITADASGIQYGQSTITAQPKLISPFLKANSTANNMFVNVGGKDRFPLLSYNLTGLAPGSDVTIDFDVYDLFDVTYFRYLNDTVCADPKNPTPMSDFISGYNYVSSMKEIGGGNKLEFAVTSSADIKPGQTLFDPYNQNMMNRSNLLNEGTSGIIPHGGSKHMTYTTTVPETGSVSFYFYKTSDCFKIPIGIDNIKVVGSIKPSIAYTGNPCPEQPLRVFTKQTYPAGTLFSWEETVTSQPSTDASFTFIPKAPKTDYTVTCEVSLDGCNPVKSEPLTIHSGTCCTSDDGAPMAMTNLFFDDFGNFVSDDLYEWTDRMGVVHQEKIPMGHTHEAQSLPDRPKIPCVRAYNIESTGATLRVPYLKDAGLNKQLYDGGLYAISAHGGYPSGVKNDNSGTSTGGMLQFDLAGDGSQDEFFEIDVDHICTGKKITFGADFASISEWPGCIEVQLLHGNKLLESESESFTGGSDGWKGVNKEIFINSAEVGGASEVTITMRVKHVQSCVPNFVRDTRDYAIDNIIFQVCTPPDVNVESSVSTGKDILDLCTEDVLTLQSITSDAVKQFYLMTEGQVDPSKKIGYVYQYTFDDPATESEINKIEWKTIHSDEVITKEKYDINVKDNWDAIFSQLDEDPTHEKRIYFRVVVGEYSDLIADQSWKKNSAFSPCRKISISTIPVVAGLNCAACTKPDAVVFEAVGGTTSTVDKKTVVALCPGESTVLSMKNKVHGIDKDDKDYSNYDVAWFKDDVTTAALESKQCVTGTDDVAPSITVNYDDVTAAGTKYIISLHDYFEGAAPTSCDITDTIIVKANPTPTTPLVSPDPFCVGTLKATDEPVKTATGFDIIWYDGADSTTASKTTAPEIMSMTASEDFYYVAQDKATGCRTDVETYSVTVNEADLLPTTTKEVSYMKSDNPIVDLTSKDPTILTEFFSKTGYKSMWGQVVGETTKTEPDLATATLGTASTTVPTPTVVSKTAPATEYLWYYVYQVSPEGCESNKVPIMVEITGAPTPKVKNGEFCSTESAGVLSDYAAIDNTIPGTYTLTFYESDETTIITDPDTYVPNISTPGEYVFYVSQSSAAGGESEKKKITITSYGVKDVVITPASNKYCLGSTAADVDALVTDATAASEFYKSSTDREFFKGTAPSANVADLTAALTMSVSTATKGETSYFVRNTYTITNAASATLITNSSTCYGDSKQYDVEIISLDKPTGDGNVSYLKDEALSNGGQYVLPLTKNPNAVKADGSNELVWYSAVTLDAASKTTEAAATPTYNASLVGNAEQTFYVTQKMTIAPSCESPATEVKISVSGYPQPTVVPQEFCEGSTSLDGTKHLSDFVTKGSTATNAASDFELVWYASKADGTIDKSAEISDPVLDVATFKPLGLQSKTEHVYYVLQRLTSNPAAEGAPARITVTIHALPVLKATSTEPICGSLNESIDLRDMYTESSDPTFVLTREYSDGVGGTISETNPIVKERGTYQVSANYTIATGEVCKSLTLPLTVFVHEVTPVITPEPKTTCPGVSVDLTASATTAGAVLNDIKYYWSNDKNTEVGDGTKSYNTGSIGLENTGDVMTVSLKVDAGACKGVPAVATHKITVDDGQLIGTISFMEDKNSNSPSTPVSVATSNITFPSCGKNVTANISVTATEVDYTYTMDGGSPKSGKFDASGNATLSLPAGTYEFSYVNRCNTSFKFTIVDVSTVAEELQRSKLNICEGEEFKVEIKVTPKTAGYPYTIEWYKDNTIILNESDAIYKVSNTVPGHSGVYSYKVLSGGCVTENKVADGLPLVVKPYIKIDRASMQRVYEAVREENVPINIPFIEPSSPASIASDIVWTDELTPLSFTGASVNLPYLDHDHIFDIKVSSDGYCDDTTKIFVYVDAKLQMKASLDVDEMCLNENHTITIDTTGTGKVLHKDKWSLVVEEVYTDASGTKTIKLLPSNGVLSATISPAKDAEYRISYTYQVGNQSVSDALPMTVHDAFDVQFSYSSKEVCEGEQTEITVERLYPNDTKLEWEPDSDILNSGDHGATVLPVFTSTSSFSQRKRYHVVATNGICRDKDYYPEITVDKPLDGEISALEYICEDTKLKLDARSFNATDYKWYSDDQLGVGVTLSGAVVEVVPKPEYAEFFVDMTRGVCTATASHTVIVTYAPKLDYIDSLTFHTIEIVLQSGSGTEPFRYIIDGNETADDVNSAVKHDVLYGKHTLVVKDFAECQIKHEFFVNSPVITIPVHMSPNGDGVNDRFEINYLKEAYPDANVSIFDRWGKRVGYYKASDSDGWDGTYNGKKLPSTDYWYEVEIKELNKTYTGHFTLLRQ